MSVRVPEISVAVATRRRPARLARLLDSLERQSLHPEAFEVLITVDGPDPDTEALLQTRSRNTPISMVVSVLDRPSGPAAGRNAAWRQARAPLVAFTDDDCEPAPDWLETLVDRARREPGVIIQGQTFPNPADVANEGPFSRTLSIPVATPWYQTCNIAYPREILDGLGGFDEAFTEAAGEDVDLGWRAVGSGAAVTFEPRACVLHAIEDLGPIGYLHQANRGASMALTFRQHPDLRSSSMFARIFWTRTHALLLLSMLALALGRHNRVVYLLTLPYLKSLVGRSRRRPQPTVYFAPYLILWDLIHLSTGLRGSLRYRVPMI